MPTKSAYIALLILLVSTGLTHVYPLNWMEYRLQMTELLFIILFINIIYKNYVINWLYDFLERNRIAFLILSGYLLINIISAIHSGNLMSCIEAGGRVYLIGLLLLSAFLYSHIKEREILPIIAWTSLAIGIITSSGYLIDQLFALNLVTVTFTDYPYIGSVNRLRGFMGSPAMLVSYGLMLWTPLTVSFRGFTRTRWCYLAAYFLLSIVLILSFSKSLLLMVMVGSLVACNTKGPHWIKYSIVGGCSLLLFLSTHWIVGYNSNDPTTLENTYYTTNRNWPLTENYSIWETSYTGLKIKSVEVACQNPWIGVGPGNFNRSLEERQLEGTYPGHLPLYDPHSTYLGGLAENGILGFIFIMCMMLASYRSIKISGMSILNSSVGLVLLCFYIDALSMDILNFRHMWIFAGVLIVWSESKS